MNDNTISIFLQPDKFQQEEEVAHSLLVQSMVTGAPGGPGRDAQSPVSKAPGPGPEPVQTQHLPMEASPVLVLTQTRGLAIHSSCAQVRYFSVKMNYYTCFTFFH